MDSEITIDGPAENTSPAAPTIFSSDTAKRTAQNATALALSNIASKGLLFVWQLVLARWLGTAGYGTYGTIGALLAVGAAVPELGMGLIVLREVANRPKDAGRFLAATLVMQPVLAVVGYIALLVAALALGYAADLRALLVLAGANLLVDVLGNMCHNQLLAMERMVITALISIAHIVLLVGVAGIVLAAGGGLWGLYIVTIAAGLFRTGLYWVILLRFGVRPQFPFDRAIARYLVVNGAPLAAMSFLSLAYMHSDKIITTALIGEASTGQLTAGFVLVFGIIELLSTTVLVAVFPLMSRAHGTGQREFFEFMIEKLAFFNAILSLPIGVYTSLLAVPLSALIFGEAYTRTADVLQVLIWYTVAAMVTAVFAQGLMIENRQTRLLAIRSGGLVINVVLNILLLPAIGVAGAAVATLSAELFILVLVVRSFTFPTEWWARARGHIWRLAVITVSLAAVVLVLRGVYPLVAAIVGVPVYGLLVLFSGTIARDDWDLIYRMAVAVPGGTIIQRYWKRELV